MHNIFPSLAQHVYETGLHRSDFFIIYKFRWRVQSKQDITGFKSNPEGKISTSDALVKQENFQNILVYVNYFTALNENLAASKIRNPFFSLLEFYEKESLKDRNGNGNKRYLKAQERKTVAALKTPLPLLCHFRDFRR